MSHELMELVLPRLAKRLNRQLRRFREGRLDAGEFSRRFEHLLQQQHAWLARQGHAEVDAALTIHGAVLVLSAPGLRAEAEEESLPLEVIEFRAVKAAAEDVHEQYGISTKRAIRLIGDLVAAYST